MYNSSVYFEPFPCLSPGSTAPVFVASLWRSLTGFLPEPFVPARAGMGILWMALYRILTSVARLKPA